MDVFLSCIFSFFKSKKRWLFFELLLLVLCICTAFQDVLNEVFAKFIDIVPYVHEISETVRLFSIFNIAIIVCLIFCVVYLYFYLDICFVRYNSVWCKSEELSKLSNIKSARIRSKLLTKRDIKKYNSMSGDIIKTNYFVVDVDFKDDILKRSKYIQVYYHKPLGVFFFIDKFGDVLGSDRRLFSHKEVCIKPEVVSNFNEEFKDYIIKD